MQPPFTPHPYSSTYGRLFDPNGRQIAGASVFGFIAGWQDLRGDAAYPGTGWLPPEFVPGPRDFISTPPYQVPYGPARRAVRQQRLGIF